MRIPIRAALLVSASIASAHLVAVITHNDALSTAAGAALLVTLVALIWSWRRVRTTDDAIAEDRRRALQTILDHAPIGIWKLNTDGRMTFVNKTFCDLLGIPESRFHEVPYSELLEPETVRSCQASDRVALGQSAPYVSREQVRFVDGQMHDLQITKVRVVDEAGRPTGLIGQAIDITNHVRAERKMAESEGLFRLLVESTDDIVSLHSPPGERLYASPSFYRLTGWTPEDITGTDFSCRVHPEDLDAIYACRDANHRGEATRIEYRCLCKDGTFIWLDLRATPILSASDGSVEKVLCVSRDVTQRHIAADRDHAALELAIKLSKCDQIKDAAEAVLEALAAGSETGEIALSCALARRSAVLVYEHDGVCRFVASRGLSEAYQKAVEGHCPWKAGATDATTIVVDDVRSDPALTAYQELFARERIGTLAFLPLATDEGVVGKIMLYDELPGSLSHAQIKAAESVAAYAGVAVGRILATQRLERSERRFRALVEGADVIVWEYDCEADVFTYVSPQAARLGYPLEEWSKVGFWQERLHPEDRDAAIAFCLEQTAAGKDHRFQYRMRKADGSIVWIDDFVTVEPGPCGLPTLRGVLVDITDRKRDEAALVEARAAADAASRAKSEFLANMSHEIRTPLTAILGYAELLRDDAELSKSPERRLQHIDVIHDAGQHLLTVINDILDLSKIEAEKMTVETVETPVVRVLAEVESLVRPRAAAKGVTLTARLATPVPDRVLSDPTRLRQILMNLAGNAAKFTREGRVTMTARVLGHGQTSRLIIDVEDTGPGMTPEEAARIFAAFSQADTTVTRQHGGTGLGLVISRRLARLLGGDVTLERTGVGQGSCFRLDLPLVLAPDAEYVADLETVDAELQPSGRGNGVRLSGRILLAEDSLINQRLISLVLTKAGADVEIAENGVAALELFHRAITDGRPYDLLLTDIQMPEMDGYALARRLREADFTLPIIALTANAMAEDRERCIAAGCDDYAKKPIDKGALLQMCRDWMGSSRDAAVTPRLR